jgi:outer membrane protein assembly factor BamB
MADDRFSFTPEHVEEQIAWLRRQAPAQSARQGKLDERQLVVDLQQFYQQEIADEHSLQAVRARLESQTASARGRRQSRPGEAGRRVAPSGPPGFSAARPRRSLAARFVAIAAAVLLVVVVAGLVAGLVLVSHHPNVAGNPTAPVGSTPTLPPAPPTVYGISHDNSVMALDPTTGATRWQQSFPDATHMILFAVQNQTLYVEKDNQNKQTATLIALSARDGSQRWEIAPFSAGGITITKTLIVTSLDATVQAWDAQTGAKRWTFQGPPIGTQIEGLDVDEAADTVYAAGFDNQSSSVIYAINSTTGKERWHVRDVRMVAAIDQTIYITDPTAGLTFTALNASDGTERWHIQADSAGGGWSQPTILNGIVYITEFSATGDGQQNQGVLYAFQASDGHERWHTAPAQDGAFSQVVLSQGVVYTSDAKGIYAFNGDTGQQRWHTRYESFLNSDTPVVQNGQVFMGWTGTSTTSGNLTYVVTVLDATTGVERWRYLVDDYTPPVPDSAPEPAPLVGNGVAFVISNYDALSQGIQALRASDGTPLWKKHYLTDITVT